MITGDQQAIGIETARQLGMGTNIFKMDALLAAKAGSGLVEGYASVEQLVEQADGFAEVFPEHKFEVVKMLQVQWHGSVGQLVLCVCSWYAALYSCCLCLEVSHKHAMAGAVTGNVSHAAKPCLQLLLPICVLVHVTAGPEPHGGHDRGWRK